MCYVSLSDPPAPRTNIQITGNSSEGCQRLHTWQIQELEAEYPKFFPLIAAQETVVHLELPENRIITILHINADDTATLISSSFHLLGELEHGCQS